MKIGLKLWSINTDVINETIKLYEQNYFDYIELYVVPDSYNTITLWKKLSIPFIIHFPHALHKINLADKFKRKQNLFVYKNIKNFADILKVSNIIIHGGIEGNIDELIYQIKIFNDERIIIENKPLIVFFQKGLIKKYCRGATVEEINYVLQNTSCGFCLDISHAICSANSQHIDPYYYISQFNALKPVMYHISDMDNINSLFDSHSHLGNGEIDFDKVFNYINNSAMITIETAQLTKTNQDGFINDVRFIRHYN